MGRVADLSRTVIEQREEIARLKGLKGRPDIKPGKPSGMEKASRPAWPSKPPRGGGGQTSERVIHEDRILKASVPLGSRFKGYEDFIVNDIVLRAHVVREFIWFSSCISPRPLTTPTTCLRSRSAFSSCSS